MSQLRFNKEGVLIPQKIRYDIKLDERDKELIDEFIKDECNFKIKHNSEGDPEFNEKNKEEKRFEK